MTLILHFINLHNVVTKWVKKNIINMMVPTQELIKARQGLLQVIFCTTPAGEKVWNHIAFIPPRLIF